MTTNISKIRDEKLTEDEKMEIIADYLENGGGGSSKLRVKVKVDYVPTAAAEIRDASEVGMVGYAYTAMTGISFEGADGEPISVEDVAAAVRDGNIELIDFEHLGDIVIKNGDAVTVQPTLFNVTSLAASCARVDDGSDGGFIVSGQFWAMEFSFPFLVGVSQGQPVAIVGVVYQQ